MTETDEFLNIELISYTSPGAVSDSNPKHHYHYHPCYCSNYMNYLQLQLPLTV